MGTVVYASAGGHRFHASQECPALIAGQSANGDGSHYAGTNVPIGTYSPVAVAIPEAMGGGKLPCLACLPELHASWFRTSSEDDFGHEPFEYDGALYCRRCWTNQRRPGDAGRASTIGRELVFWPCASAVVLGLVDPAATQ